MFLVLDFGGGFALFCANRFIEINKNKEEGHEPSLHDYRKRRDDWEQCLSRTEQNKTPFPAEHSGYEPVQRNPEPLDQNPRERGWSADC